MNDFRLAVREWETAAEGLMHSFVGKLSGLTALVSLVLSYLDWATDEGEGPHEVTASEFCLLRQA